jgi:hypothetical protein
MDFNPSKSQIVRKVYDTRQKAIRTVRGKLGNSLDVVKTNISTTAKKINTPEDARDFTVIHKEDGEIVYVKGPGVTVSTGYPLEAGEELIFENMKKNDDNEIYGITSTGDVDIYAIAKVKI